MEPSLSSSPPPPPKHHRHLEDEKELEKAGGHHLLCVDDWAPARLVRLFPQTEADVEAFAAAACENLRRAVAAICAVPPHERTFANTARATDLARGELAAARAALSVVNKTAGDAVVRLAAAEALVDLHAAGIDLLSSNRELYGAILKLHNATVRSDGSGGDCASWHAEERRWLAEELREFRRRGFDLEPAAFDRVVAIEKELAKLVVAFQTHIAEDRTTVRITRPSTALLGVPDSVVDEWRRSAVHGGAKQQQQQQEEEEEAPIELRVNFATYFAIVNTCAVAETRRLVAIAFESRAFPGNEQVLQELVRLRHELAVTLGCRSYTEYDLANKMMSDVDTAQRFISELVPPLQTKWAQERAEVVAAGLHESVVLAPNGDFYFYDVPFIMSAFKKRVLRFAEDELQEYFPMSATVEGIFDVCGEFFGLSFEKVSVGPLWHETVQVLRVTGTRESELLGFLVLDLERREGKCSHACCHTVVPPTLLDAPRAVGAGGGNAFAPAVVVLIAHFPTRQQKEEGTKGREAQEEGEPALLPHEMVKTFLHELGHALHGLLGRTRMATFAGAQVKQVFVELPSQILENWAWDPAVLARITRHHRTGQPLPPALIAAKVRSRTLFSGRDTLRQLQFAAFALHLFDTPFASSGADPATLLRMLLPEIMPGIAYNAAGHAECSFSHLTSFGPLYLSYLWAEVLAHDVFEQLLRPHQDQVRENGGGSIAAPTPALTSPEVGHRYVVGILRPGGSQDPNELLRAFLGRDPSNAAFLRKLCI